ncbi:MAG: septum formation family protein [Actinomycetota bacterium]
MAEITRTTIRRPARHARPVRFGAALAVAGLALAACGGASQTDETVRDESGAIVEEGEVGAFKVQVGDCISGVEEGLVETANGVTCDGMHQYEVYYSHLLPAGDYPGDVAINEAAQSECLEAFEPFVGLSYDQSVYGFTALTPVQDSWERIDDREILCLIGNYDGTDKSGSARGSAV